MENRDSSLTSTPAAIVVDTNLISGQVKRDVPEPELQALGTLYANAPSATTIWATTNAKEELARIPSDDRQAHMDVLEQYRAMPGYPADDPKRLLNVDDLLSTEAGDEAYRNLGFLPDEPDRRLIAGAAQVGAAYFATNDENTILKFRSKIEEVAGVRARRPTEIVKELNLFDPSSHS